MSGGGQTGGGLALGPLTYTDDYRDRILETLLSGYAAGELTEAEFQLELDTSPVWADVPRLTVAEATKGLEEAGGLRSPPTYPASKTIAMTHQGQINTTFCGPAAGLMILKSMGISKSAKTQDALTQQVLANNDHMKTTKNGGTDWSPANFAAGLNAARGKTPQYGHVRPASVSSLSNYVKADIYQNMPLGANLQENANTGVYNQHPKPAAGKQRGHWVALYGYSSSGATLSFDDPAGANVAVMGSAWKDAAAKFSMTATKTYTYMVAPHGLAY